MESGKQGGAGESKSSGPPALGRGASVGRYLILGLLGKGGMGEVYAAYDPELDRKVALKLLRAQPTAAGTDPSAGRARLLREAQAIARLSDPNVVVVFDVGMFDDRVFLAMEYVDGNTLGYWLQAKPRTWREVVATFSAAGRGLASAHRAGVVHRDFKPDNVMMGREGKVRVMDFGLARTIGTGGGNGATDSPAGERPRATGTSANTILGVGDVRQIGGGGTSVDRRSAPTIKAEGTSSLGSLEGHTADVIAKGVGAGAAMGGAGLLEQATGGEAVPVATMPCGGARSAAVAVAVPGGIGAWGEGDRATRDLSAEPAAGWGESPASALSAPLTETGAMMGTPAYMAPEQFQGRSIDARTDQFSFCAALYEGLYGERPFAGKNINELSANVIAGRVRPPPAKSRIPGWLRRVVLRGLRVDRAERHASMEALLAMLARDPARTRRRWMAAGSVAGLIAVLVVGLVRAEQQQRTRCLGTEAKLAGIWELPNAEGLSPRKEAIRRAFMATGKRYAADSFTVVMNQLDRYVIAWNDMHRDSCEATHMRGEQSAEVLDLRTSCLHDRFSEVRALTAVLSNADGDVVTKSVEAVQAIRPVEQCADIAALKAVVKPPADPAVRRAVADVRTALADVKALASAGRYKQALKDIPNAVDAARRTRYQAVTAEALLQLGELQQDALGDPSLAEKSYEEAVWLAEGSHHDEVALEAADQLVMNVGYTQRRHDEGKRWARFAGALLQKLGPGHDLLAAWRANNLAAVYSAEGSSEEALALFREGLATKIRAVGETHHDVAISLDNLASTLVDLGRAEEALEVSRRALEVFRKTLGLEHPVVSNALTNAAEIMNVLGRYPEAQKMAERSLAIMERELDSGHVNLAFPLTALGVSWTERGEADQALKYLERALAIREAKALEPGLLAVARFAVARALWEANVGSKRALLLAEQARAIYVRDQMHEKEKASIDRWIEARQGNLRLSMR